MEEVLLPVINYNQLILRLEFLENPSKRVTDTEIKIYRYRIEN